jgi:succinate dehydrogenase / fumarate reductase flavoprotein subunit
MRWCFATGGYGNVFFLSTNAMASNVTAAFRAYEKGAFFANPCFTQIHPTCIPVHGTYQSQADPHERKPAKRRPGVGAQKSGRQAHAPTRSPRATGTITWKTSTPVSATWSPGMWPPATPRSSATPGKGVGETGLAVYLDFADAINRDGKDVIAKNTATCSRCTKKSRPTTRTKPP